MAVYGPTKTAIQKEPDDDAKTDFPFLALSVGPMAIDGLCANRDAPVFAAESTPG